MTTTTAQVLTDAANHIQTHGWHQRAFYPDWTDDPDGPNWLEAGERINEDELPCCILGAIAACGGDDTVAAAVAAVLDLPGAGDLADWNDAPDTTRDQVLAALRKAAQS